MGYSAHDTYGEQTTDASPPPASAPDTVVDHEVFEEILDVVGPRGRQELLTHIVEDLDDVAAAMEDALDHGAAEEVRRHGHTLSGLAGTLGARTLNDMVTALLRRVHEGGRLPSSGELDLIPEIGRLRAFCAGLVDRDRLA